MILLEFVRICKEISDNRRFKRDNNIVNQTTNLSLGLLERSIHVFYW